MGLHVEYYGPEPTVMVTVTFDAIGGTGGTTSVAATYGSAMPSITVPTRTGYTFGGYWTGTNGSGTQYYNASGASAQDWDLTSATTLYAHWTLSSAYGKIQLWADGPYWAEKNVGADEPWDYGYYFWWGDTIGYKRENDQWVASDGSSSGFSFYVNEQIQTDQKTLDDLRSSGWITADGVLAPEHDAAQVQWGNGWRMPTDQEINDLRLKCDWTQTTLNGVDGYEVRGKGDYDSASIFLPCAGEGDWFSLSNASSRGYYWSSAPNSDNGHAWSLYFYSGIRGTDYYDRCYGRSVRPVQDAE